MQASYLLIRECDLPLGTLSIGPAGTFLSFKNSKWRPNISRRYTAELKLLLTNTPALQAKLYYEWNLYLLISFFWWGIPENPQKRVEFLLRSLKRLTFYQRINVFLYPANESTFCKLILKIKLSVREDIKKEVKRLGMIGKSRLEGKAVNTPHGNRLNR